MTEKPVLKFREINDGIEEGRLLVMAVAVITSTPGYTNKTPDAVLARLVHLEGKVYGTKSVKGMQPNEKA